MSKASFDAPPPPADPEALRRENQQLRKEVERFRAAEAKSAERKKRIAKAAGSMILPIFDRQRVVRSFMALIETVAGFAGPRESWPTRDDVINDGKMFAVAFMRFVVKRRIFMLVFSLLAFSVPGLQLYVALKQNEIIENQNKYFDIQVYDTVTRAITSGDTTAKQITTALLAREDFDLLNGIISQVFTTEASGAFSSQDVGRSQPLFLRETAARGHLIAALTQAIERRGEHVGASKTWKELEPTLRAVMVDASYRVPQLLRINLGSDDQVNHEALRYVFNLGLLIRKAWACAVSASEDKRFFAAVSGYFNGAAQARAGGDAQFSTVFVSGTQEVLLDLAERPKLGDAPKTTPDDKVPALLTKGFQILRQGIAPKNGGAWDNFKRTLEVP